MKEEITPDQAKKSAAYKIEKMLPYGSEDEEASIKKIKTLWEQQKLTELYCYVLLEVIRHQNALAFWKTLSTNITTMIENQNG